MAYSAIVTRINTRPHPNADKLQLGTCRGYQVVIGKDVKDGEPGVFFPCDGQLSDEFCKANDLYPRLDEKGKRIGGGFMDQKNRRVRSQGFRGQKSEGFWVPLAYFSYLNTAVFEMDVILAKSGEGFEFTELEGHPICNKYFNEATFAILAHVRKKGARRETTMFKAHIETEQLRKKLQLIKSDAEIIFTEKLHGTSGRYGNVLHEQPLGWFRRTVNMLTGREIYKRKTDWTYVIGTRNVILDPFFSTGEKFRENVVTTLKGNLHKGETVYFEIVGFDHNDKPIMPPQDTMKMDREVFNRYGENMIYSYGQARGTCGLYVYRITMTNEDGYTVEYPWKLVKARCIKLGVKHVPELETLLPYSTAPQKLVDNAVLLSEGVCTINPNHIREGVCVRAEQGDETIIFKEKSFTFKVLEGIVKENEKVVDLEEVS